MTWKLVVAMKGALPSARNNHATAVVGSQLFFHGGHDGGKWLDDCKGKFEFTVFQ
jgi:hypothetical protein